MADIPGLAFFGSYRPGLNLSGAVTACREAAIRPAFEIKTMNEYGRALLVVPRVPGLHRRHG
jgi:hypothetical protein